MSIHNACEQMYQNEDNIDRYTFKDYILMCVAIVFSVGPIIVALYLFYRGWQTFYEFGGVK